MIYFRLFFLLLLMGVTAALQAKVPIVPEEELNPTDIHTRATTIIRHIVKNYHYKKINIDDELSASILEKYLEHLDLNRSFFLQSDIDNFSRYKTLMDDAINESNTTPAFEIFKIYLKRVDERVDYALKALDLGFNFEIDESYIFDRREQPWADSGKTLDDIWRKRVKNDILNLKLSRKKDEDINDTLHKRYERLRINAHQLDSNDVYQTFINAFTTSIEPHTAYFSPRTSENFDISMRLSLEGIGAVLRSENEYTMIQSIITGGPADLSGKLKAEDRIVGVGQGSEGEIVDVIGWRLDDVVDLIRGPKDTTVRLDILPKDTGPDGASRTVSLIRDRIKLEEQAAKSSVIELPGTGDRIGVIDLPTFYIDFSAQARGEKDYRSTSRDVRKLINELTAQGIEGLVIDLRGNGGGSLSEALELTGLFILEGPIVQTRDATGKISVNEDPDPSIVYGGPLAVLVDRNSASASEIFAGAIQDYQRGIIIGEPTFGKGTVQNIVDLNRFVRDNDADHGKLKTTIAQFFRINGGSNQHKGVIPDIIFPTADDSSEQGERSLENALPWDKVKPARYIKASAPVESYLSIRKKHEERIKSDRAFNLLIKKMDLVKENNDRIEVTLHESKRKQERDHLNTSQRELNNQLRVLQGLEPLTEEEIEKEKLEETAEKEDEEPFDILLNETANILDDLIKHATDDNRGLQAIKIPEQRLGAESF